MKVIPILITVIIVIFMLAICTIAVCAFIETATEEEVETYIVGMEIIEKDYSTYYIKNSGARTEYILNARGSGESFVEKVGEQTYAKYAVGDIVEVEVRVMETKTRIWKEYTILGFIGE